MHIDDIIIGQRVQYTPWEGCPTSQIEFGTVTGKNEIYAFVKYDGDVDSKVTSPRDLGDIGE